MACLETGRRVRTVCKRCASVGYRLIDTAQVYGNEEGVGSAWRKSGIARNELFIVTKIWITNSGEERAAESINESLRKLQTDYVDLLLIHQPYGDVLERGVQWKKHIKMVKHVHWRI